MPIDDQIDLLLSFMKYADDSEKQDLIFQIDLLKSFKKYEHEPSGIGG
jgi:hypothetical protein